MSDPPDSNTGDQINIGDISQSSGIAIGRGAKATVSQGLGADDISHLFATIYREIQARPLDPDVGRAEITEVVQKIENESTKGSDSNPKKIERWLRNLANMAPDIADVTIATLTSPAAGIAATVRKIAQKVKESAGRP